MEQRLVGFDARWFIDDVEMLFGAGMGEPILIGIDLAPEPELVRLSMEKPVRDPVELPRVKRTHPTTARELRRAERQRRR